VSADDPKLPLLIRLYQQYLTDEDAARFIYDVSVRYMLATLVRLAEFGDRVQRRAAMMALGFLGDYSHNTVFGCALLDDDRVVRLLAEDGIRGAWKREGSEDDQQMLRRLERLNYTEQHEQALALATEMIERVPYVAEAWNQRAVAYYHLKQFQLSANDCHQALEINPYHFAASVGMGHCFLEMDDAFAALECFRRSLRINPDLEGVRAQVQYLERTLEGK